ncbi:heterokaryon incompatibility protein-domain-containing protein, partial [Mycena haematopus]
FAALSYVWGVPDQPHKTTTANIEKYVEEGIEFDLIPTTIADAIRVTQRLGIPYLWVDAYCIIQDDDNDKSQEISQMKNIFGNSYLTIVAASASKVTDGFLRDRPEFGDSYLLPFVCPGGSVGSVLLRTNFYGPESPVNQRAWCLEEGILPCRTLSFGSYLWLACRTRESVDIDGAKPHKTITLMSPTRHLIPSAAFGDPLTTLGGYDAEGAWYKVIQEYTHRTVTKPRDRLPALAGVTELFHKFWPDSQYRAGLWTMHLPYCLLWRTTAIDNQKDNIVHPPSSQARRPPSWSWAAMMNVGVRYDSYSPEERSQFKVVCKVVSCEATLAKDRFPYGEVAGGVIILQ